jgi:hypothetical protein
MKEAAMSIPYALLAVVQERIAGVLDRDDSDLLPEVSMDGDLLTQLRDVGVRVPRGLELGLGRLLGAADLDELADTKDDDGVLTRLRGRVGGIAEGLLEGRGVASIADSVKDIFKSTGGATVDLGGLLRRQGSIAVSFVTTLRNIPSPATVVAVREGWNEYFFGERGFVTLDDVPIVAPDQLGALKGRLMEEGPAVLKSVLAERKADRYARDLIRIMLEVVGDVRYDDLRARYATLLAKLPDEETRAKATRWFRGVGSHAEAVVTSAVEEATLGIATFQTNPLIAASAATYAGTAARKAAQHVFLSLTE